MNRVTVYKKSFFAVLFFITSHLIVHAQSFDTSLTKVIVIRPAEDVGFTNVFKITINDTLTLKLSNNSYYSFYSKPGMLRYKTYVPDSEDSIELSIDETNYLLLKYTYGFWKPKPNVYAIQASNGNTLMTMHKPKDIRKPTQRYLYRIGLLLGGGAGFNDFPIIKTTDNEDVNIGFGGGLSIGIEAGFERSKYFDIAIGYRYLNRGLSPTLKNASMQFSRHVFSLTPSFILPLNSGNMHRFKFGVGIDYYAFNSMVIKTSNLQYGIEDTWRYKPTVGYQAKIAYEFNFTEQLSFLLATRYNHVSHQFKSSTKYYPTDTKFINPLGNGIEVLMGIQFHF